MISGKRTGGRCGVWLRYDRITQLEAMKEQSGESVSRLIALCVEKGIDELCREKGLRPPRRHLPTDRSSYLASKGLSLD